MTTLLPASLQLALQGIVERANMRGALLRAILLSTTEGVPLGRVVVDTAPDGSRWNEDVLASIESVWAPASKQFPVLGLDKVQQVTAIYDHGTLLHIYQAPLVITLLCGPQGNLGAVRSTAIPMLKEVLEPLARELVNSLQLEPNATFAVANTGYYR